jgi:hypothetical protein
MKLPRASPCAARCAAEPIARARRMEHWVAFGMFAQSNKDAAAG